MFNKFFIFLAAIALLCLSTVEAGNGKKIDPQVLATYLENQFWAAVQNDDRPALFIKISPIFQGGNNFRFVDKFREIDELIDLDLESFDITNLVATRSGDVLVVTYTFSAVESGIAVQHNRMSVWERFRICKNQSSSHKHRWRLVAQAVFSDFP